MNKSITVVAPAYNHEKFIESCLWSVADQNCSGMELIIIDDCSSDSTPSIITRILSDEKFCNAFDLGVQFIPHKKNAGAHSTINEGLLMAKGEFLAVINTDDKFGDNHLKLLLDACERETSEFAFGGVCVIDEFDQKITKGYGKEIMKYQDVAKMCPTVTMALTRGNSAISTGNMIFSADLYQKLGGFRNYKYVHDWDFALRAALRTEPVFVPEAIYYYRLHGSNTISEITDRHEDANAMESHDSNQAEDPLSLFFYKIRSGEFINTKIPPINVWDYYFQYKKYYYDDYAAKMVWEKTGFQC